MTATTATLAQRPLRQSRRRRAPGPLDGRGPEADSQGSLPGRLLKALAGQITSRVPPADLDERDPDYIRESLPGLWLLSSLYFRGEVRGLGNIPEEGPCPAGGQPLGRQPHARHHRLHARLHTPTSASSGASTSSPTTSCCRCRGWASCASSAPSPRRPPTRRRRCARAPRVLVYPGGDYEVHRPTWHGHRVDFDGRRGFIRLALEHDVPIVPVVSIGGQETALFLSRGETLSRLLGLDRLLRLKVLPISLAIRGASTSATSWATSRCRPRSPSRRCPRSGCAMSSAPSPTSTRPTSTCCA